MSEVAQISGVFGVPVEIRTRGEARRCNPVNHRTVSQNGKVKRRPVERDELRRQGRNLIREGRDQLLISRFLQARRGSRGR
jgi:hypothetical protein